MTFPPFEVEVTELFLEVLQPRIGHQTKRAENGSTRGRMMMIGNHLLVVTKIVALAKKQENEAHNGDEQNMRNVNEQDNNNTQVPDPRMAGSAQNTDNKNKAVCAMSERERRYVERSVGEA